MLSTRRSRTRHPAPTWSPPYIVVPQTINLSCVEAPDARD